MSKRGLVHITYVRVLKWKAFQVEIHPLKLSTTSSQRETTAWFQDLHLQEVLLLLKDIMYERAVLKNKDLDTVKTSKSEILTGTNVRLGYSFKRKQDNQICLLPAEFSEIHNSEADNGTPRYRNLVLHSEKLVVYTYPLHGSSQQNMITILSSLREPHQSQSQKVCISNYFQKKSPKKTLTQNVKDSGHSSTKNSEITGFATSQKALTTENKPKLLLDAPVNAGRKRTMKRMYIIKKSRPILSNIKKRKVEKSEITTSCTGLVTTNHSDRKPHTHSEKQTICNDKHEDYTSDCKLSLIDGDMIQNWSVKNTARESNVTGQCCDVLRKKCEVDTIKQCFVRLVDSSITDNKQRSHTAELRNTRKNSRDKKNLQASINDSSLDLHNSNVERDQSCSLISHHSDRSDNMFRSLSPEATCTTSSKSCDKLPALCVSDQSDTLTSKVSVMPEITACSPDLFKIEAHHKEKVVQPILKSKCLSVNMLRKIAKHNSSMKQNNAQDKMAESPERAKNINISDQKDLASSKLYHDPYELEMSPKKTPKKFKLKRKAVHKKASSRARHVNVSESDESINNSDVDASDDCELKLPEIFCKKRARWKKRLTEIFPLQEESTADAETCKTLDADHKHREISDPFTCNSDDDINVGNKGDSIKPDSKLLHLQSNVDRNMAELTQELKQIRCVNNIQNLHLEKLVFGHESYLRMLFQGQICCWRHQEYKKGGSSRANLNYCVHFGLFTEEQQDVVMETLMAIFCKKHHKYLDYIMKVLLPEILIKILMEMKDLSHEEADALLATTQE